MLLRDSTALVTGASRGIGRAVAEALVAAGARVIALARTPIVAPGLTALAIDLLDPSAAHEAAQAVEREWGAAPDILINNAGLFHVAPIADTDPADFDRMLAVNLAAPFRLMHAFLPGMRARGRGHVVTIGSIADHVAFPGNAAYAASKFGLRGLHEVLRAEVAGSGIRATLIAPGAVDTPIWGTLDPAVRATFPAGEAMLDVADVTDAVVFALTRPPAVSVDEIRLSTC